MSEEFYITLLSNSSHQYFPDNKTSSFITKLPKSIHLEDQWEVALVELHYPSTLLAVSTNQNIIYYTWECSGLTIPHKTNIKSKYYSDLDELLSHINTTEPLKSRVCKFTIDQESKKIELQYVRNADTELHYNTEKNILKLDDVKNYKTNLKPVIEKNSKTILKSVIEKNSKTILKPIIEKNSKTILKPVTNSRTVLTDTSVSSITSGSLTNISFSPKLALQLGYEPHVNVIANQKALFMPNLDIAKPSQIFVYSDIIEPQIIGDSMSQVLRVVTNEDKNKHFGVSVAQVFTQPHYVRVLKRVFDFVEINLRTETGEPAPFQFGTSCVKLHFRKLS